MFEVYEDFDRSLVDIQGGGIPSRGKVVIPVKLVNPKEFEHEFIVVDTPLRFETDLLLGLDFLHKFRIKVDWGRG